MDVSTNFEAQVTPRPRLGRRGTISLKRGEHADDLKALMGGKSFTDFELHETVGVGSYARVRVAKMKGSTDGSVVAFKIFQKSEVIRLKQVEHVRAEKQILASIDHPFIVNLLATFQDEKRLYMLLEYVNGGELFSYLRKEARLPNDTARFYSAEILLALQYLHSLHVVYRDLKPENVLIDGNGHIKITDFGFAKVVEDKTWTLCGTPEYLAPEMIQSKGHGKAVDWWALGILIFEMLAGYPPFYDSTPLAIYRKVLTGVIQFPRHIDAKAKDLIKLLLTLDKVKRFGCLKAGADDVKRHKWYQGLEWDFLFLRTIPAPYVPAVTSADDTSMFDRYPEVDEVTTAPLTAKDQEAFEGFETL